MYNYIYVFLHLYLGLVYYLLMQVLDLLHGVFEVISMVPDVKTVEGEEVIEEVKSTVLREWKKSIGWMVVGDTISVTKEEREQGPLWEISWSQCRGPVAMTLNREKPQTEILLEGIFEEGKLGTKMWWKRMEQEVWTEGSKYTIYLDADNALVWEVLEHFMLRGRGDPREVVVKQVVRTRRLVV